MTYKAITFFDLDGTLLDAHSQITPEVADAMAQLKANNVLPVIATGRTETQIQHILKDSGIQSDIVMNGMFIRAEGQIIYSNHFSSEECQAMLDLVRELGHEVAFHNEKDIFCSGISDIMEEAFGFIHEKAPRVDPQGFLTEPVNMLLSLSKEGDEAYHERFPDFTFYRNSPYSIDIVKKGISKGTGVFELKKQLGLETIPTYGFGDGPNDFPLLAACDHKIAMGNAREGLKELADFVTKNNTDGGIVHALRHFDLI